METEQKRLEKNKLISQTKRSTIVRHSSMLCKTFDIKIQENQLNKLQKEALQKIFVEQKWYKNYILSWCEQDKNNKLSKFNIKIIDITHKDKDLNDVPVTIKYLSASQRQCLVSRMYANIKTLHTLKVNGKQNPGKLKFSKEETIIDLKQYGMTHKIISSKRIKIQGIPKTLVVNGLKQFVNTPELEYANARLIHRGTGYYVQFIVYVPKENKTKEKIKEVLGIDFGCSTAFTLSTGEKINAKIQESERLKRLQKKQARQVKSSKGWYQTVQKVRKEYQKQTNRKNDLANKLVHKFLQYETVAIQDEQLQNWHKNGHGKAVQHSVLGRVKAKLKIMPNVVVLGKTVPTTKLCTKCGQWHDEIKVWNRTFKCGCGVEMDRDIHAAKNMVWFYENNVGVGRTKIKRVEMKALVDAALSSENQLLSAKLEDSSL